MKEAHQRLDSPNSQSRRDLIKAAAAFAAAGSVPLAQSNDDDESRHRQGAILAYIGTYTPNGQGIHLYSMNPSTGNLTPLKVFPSSSPSWLAFDPAKKYLYAGNEINPGLVSAYAVNPANGDLTFLNSVAAGGSPAHVSVDPKGQFVFVANYGGGTVAVLPILSNGGLGVATDIKNTNTACSPACPVGPTKAQNAPPGSFAISGHDAPHAHMIEADAAGNYLIAQDLGLDLTIVWSLDRQNGKLVNHQTVPSSPGAGPRHFAFHPNGRWFYSLNEESSTLTFMTYNAATGLLTPQEEISTLPASFTGTNFTSEVIVSKDGRFVYCCNRLHNSVAIFDVEGTGKVKLIGETWTRADYPRNCNIDPTGNFMYVCHNRSDNVTTFRVNRGSGRLSFTGQYVPVGSPAVITFL